MNPRERLAWLLVVALTATVTTLWWRGRSRYEFRTGSDGAIIRKLDRESGEAWAAAWGSKTWKPIAQPSDFASEKDGFDTGKTAYRNDPFGNLVPTNRPVR